MECRVTWPVSCGAGYGCCDVAYTHSNKRRMPARTFPPHADFEAFLQAAVLALVAVVLVHGTVPAGPAGVGQVPPDAALEEALTSLARELSVVLAAGLVPAHDALDLLALLFVHGRGGGG